MAVYDITLSGCDDSTTVMAELSEAQLSAFERVAAQTQAASQFECQPKMTVTKHVEVITPDE